MTYIDLVNKLRDRFNEVHLDAASTWTTAIGFDQFTKDAVNYAYRDIINAELQWPFSHVSGTIYTVPGKQFYTLTTDAIYTVPTGFLNEIDTVDWESFYLGSNQTVETYTGETGTIPSASPYSVTVTHANGSTTSTITGNIQYFYQNTSVTIAGSAATAVTGVPTTGQYAVQNGVYVFSSADAGKAYSISYQVVSQAPSSFPTPITAAHLPYIDYDYWRQKYLSVDLNAIPQTYAKPMSVFKPNISGQIGLTPVPDQVYNVFCEFWLDATDLSNTTDTPIIPQHFWYVILDGAQKYCYEFREDGQLAAMADQRFQTGIERMRIELINRDSTMNSGFNWYRLGYTSPYIYI